MLEKARDSYCSQSVYVCVCACAQFCVSNISRKEGISSEVQTFANVQRAIGHELLLLLIHFLHQCSIVSIQQNVSSDPRL